MINLTPAQLDAEVAATRVALVAYTVAPTGLRPSGTTPAQNLAILATELPLPTPISTSTKRVNIVTGAPVAGPAIPTNYLVQARWNFDSGVVGQYDKIEHTFNLTAAELTVP